MRRRNRQGLVFLVFLILWGIFLVTAGLGAYQEVRQAGQLSGTIVAPVEERKQALSAGDKVFIALDKEVPVKKGDLMEIYQPAPNLEGKPRFHYIRVGEVIVLEPVNGRLFLAVIENSNREIAVGDRIFIPERR